MEKGLIGEDASLGDIFSSQTVPPDKAKISIYHLLHHTSGLPSWRPFYERVHGKEAYFELIMNEPLEAPPGQKTIYSDLGFMLLGFIAERITDKPLKVLFEEEVLAPLKVDGMGFLPQKLEKVAPSSFCPFRKRMLKGEVNDSNARALGGIAGHAGLFGSARSLLNFLIKLLHNKNFLSRYHPENLLDKSSGGRFCYGFDTPEKEGSQAGSLFSQKTLGHLGYTGTSFWMDFTQKTIVVFLTNRTYPHDSPLSRERIKALRPVLHDRVLGICHLASKKAL